MSYFFVRYIDYEVIKKAEEAEGLREGIECHLTRKDNKELIVNADCYIGIILDYVYREAGVDDSIKSDFDLYTDKGRSLNISSYPGDISGLRIFRERATYYIVHRDSDDQLKPLLKRCTREYMDFMTYLKRRSSFGRKKSNRGSLYVKSSPSKSSKGSQLLSVSSWDKKSAKSKKSAFSK